MFSILPHAFSTAVWLSQASLFMHIAHILPNTVLTSAVRGVPPQVPTTSPPAAAMPPTRPPLPLSPQQPDPPAPSPPPWLPTSTRTLSNTCRDGPLNTQRSRSVPLTFPQVLATSSWKHRSNDFHLNPHRHQDYVKKLTPWAASACPRTAPSSKTCGLWSESVKYKQHCVSRGEGLCFRRVPVNDVKHTCT